jgi:hypothetical protein
MIQLATLTKKTPQQIFARLTEMEKIDFRGASPDRITWHANNGGLGTEAQGDREVLAEVQRLCMESFSSFPQVNAFGRIPSTWKF